MHPSAPRVPLAALPTPNRQDLIAEHGLHVEATKTHLYALQLWLAAAKREHAWSRAGAEKVDAAQRAYDEALDEQTQYQMAQQFDFHANVNESGSSHFFQRPQSAKGVINSVLVNGVAVTDDATIRSQFTAHRCSIMTTPRDGHL
ncbi:hypothetical protein SPRG_15171 [Saprolegnia parasitica CBS 223.65]|uniref:Uncharacterized protein n=1 Tax=Saprolegnia parasitica (strain CBS 223.65) TaxID=695850 RepID=A0A067BW66_SAPPC|nr:hypothetical protein SPRG_15171 [Saprolegnia parasitica CBS 223.65]KDO18842.1 hypothetical protein SPRG_15171 [Saprolegnia parasitica CBS 223.65]|eukprot:XP_012210445.1 hypothetical protein SPRG_15171 [Saprolegnia parasitica CBS 223.65]